MLAPILHLVFVQLSLNEILPDNLLKIMSTLPPLLTLTALLSAFPDLVLSTALNYHLIHFLFVYCNKKICNLHKGRDLCLLLYPRCLEECVVVIDDQ